MSDSFLRKCTLSAFFAVYSLFSIHNLNKSFVLHAVKRTNVAYLQQTFGSDICILAYRNDIVIIIIWIGQNMICQNRCAWRQSTLTNFSTDSDLILEQSVLPELYGGTRDCSVAQLFFLPSFSFFLSCIYCIYTALQKFGNALEKWGFGQYWHESFLIRDNTNYENIFYYINSLYIEKN